MGSVHDEEPDCCTDNNCACKVCSEWMIFNTRCFMSIRKSNTSRIALGAFFGLVLGLSISAGKPIKPEKFHCVDQYSEYKFEPASGLGCDSYLSIPQEESSELLREVTVRRQFSLCVKQGRNQLAPIGQSCDSDVPTFTFSTLSGHEELICVGRTSETNHTYATLNDNEDCDNFDKSFGAKDGVTYEKWKAYVKDIDTLSTNPSSGGDFCFVNDTLKDTVNVSPCQHPILTLKETVVGSASLLEEYESASRVYENLIKYFFFVTGNIWLRIINLVVMPLLAANIITSVAQLRETSANSSIKLAWMTASYYVATTIFAAIESLILVNIMIIPFLKPIEDDELVLDAASLPSTSYANAGEQIESVFTAIIPANIVKETAKGGYLSIIFFSITIGSVVVLESKFLKFFADLNTMMLRMIRSLILWTPLGVFLMITYVIAHHDPLHVANNVGLFLLTVFVGLLLHLTVVYPAIYFFLTRKNPYKVLQNISTAMCTALSVSSSITTYPYTLQCATTKNKFNLSISKFVLTLGATINMDGTTIGFPIAVVFVAYAQGLTLTFGDQLLIIILSTVSSMGAAPVPQAGLVLLIAIIESLGIPLGSVFSLIMAVDWLYDRPETMVNICGDSFAAGIMHHYLHEDFEAAEKKKNDSSQGISS